MHTVQKGVNSRCVLSRNKKTGVEHRTSLGFCFTHWAQKQTMTVDFASRSRTWYLILADSSTRLQEWCEWASVNTSILFLVMSDVQQVQRHLILNLSCSCPMYWGRVEKISRISLIQQPQPKGPPLPIRPHILHQFLNHTLTLHMGPQLLVMGFTLSWRKINGTGNGTELGPGIWNGYESIMKPQRPISPTAENVQREVAHNLLMRVSLCSSVDRHKLQ